MKKKSKKLTKPWTSLDSDQDIRPGDERKQVVSYTVGGRGLLPEYPDSPPTFQPRKEAPVCLGWEGLSSQSETHTLISVLVFCFDYSALSLCHDPFSFTFSWSFLLEL